MLARGGTAATPSEGIDVIDLTDADLVAEDLTVCTGVWDLTDTTDVWDLTDTGRVGVLKRGDLTDTVRPLEVGLLTVPDATDVGVLWPGSLIDTVLPLEGVVVRAGVGVPGYAIVGGSPVCDAGRYPP